MSTKYKARELGALYFITVTVVDWVDLLTSPVYKEVVMDSLKCCQENKGLNIHAYVVMSNHWHAIVSSDENPLADIMRDMKKHMSKELISTIGKINESRRAWLLRKFEYAANRINKGVHFKVGKTVFIPYSYLLPK